MKTIKLLFVFVIGMIALQSCKESNVDKNIRLIQELEQQIKPTSTLTELDSILYKQNKLLKLLSDEERKEVCKVVYDKGNKVYESIINMENSIRAADSIVASIEKDMANIVWDTIGIDNGPIKIISAKAVDNSNEYITDKQIKISYKNVSNKKIVGIRIKWYVTNAFGEPVKDMGGNYDGFGVGLDDNPLGAGKTSSGTWDSGSGFTKNVKAWPIEVAFEDGTKWKSSFK